jgi:hypothetical protein
MPKSKIDYRPNIRGTRKLMTGPEMVALMAAAAEKGRGFAESISPVDNGEYINAFKVETTAKGGPRRNRAEARLVNESDHASDVEWINHGGERILGKTVDFIERHGA